MENTIGLYKRRDKTGTEWVKTGTTQSMLHTQNDILQTPPPRRLRLKKKEKTGLKKLPES